MRKNKNEKPNIILIITDCLRWDYFKRMRISKEVNLILENVYTPAPNTFLAIPSILTGTFPFEITSDSKIPKNFPFYLPNLLKKAGYTNIYITGNVVTSRYFNYKTPEIDFFEDFIELKKADIRKIKKIEQQTSVKDFFLEIRSNFTNKIREWPFLYTVLKRSISFIRHQKIRLHLFRNLDQSTSFDSKVRASKIISTFADAIHDLNKRPIFAFLHFMDTHAPYGPPYLGEKKLRNIEKIIVKLYKYPQLLTPKEIELLRELYGLEVDFLDKNLLELFSIIDNKLGFGNTLVIIMSDHGELLGEEGKFTHNPSNLKPELLHIPLAFWGGQVKNFAISPNTLISSILIYYFINNLLAYGEVVNTNLHKVISVSYKYFRTHYIPTGILIKDENSEEVYEFKKAPEIKLKFEKFLMERRRRLLAQRLEKRSIFRTDPGPLFFE